ncbi:malto-oligosyltrehalose trehalohydrolase [Actinotalea solisilvae]|uniref:malto-oligosyltrehalose trehalohydrolase n=1 Tax=Actinotalea solisilvae TaxID=2072922 RepID=UPI0018F13EDC|nr:malto-oligosyltrehalose trehalohydrolase [Actinotalea solisilvae]
MSDATPPEATTDPAASTASAPRTASTADAPRVWAPSAERVELHLPGRDERHAMVPDGGGWWRAPLALPDGTDYAFAVDGGEPWPDPRSPWQPAGVHGPSRTFDASAHAWADAGWTGRDVRGAVVYELHVGTFTPEGTLDAAIDRLDHLAALGVDMVELMPVAAFPGVHGWGYDGVALYAVHEPYGGPAALQRFVDAAHARGLAVCLDVVHNHLGPSGNYLHGFGPYFTDRHHTPWGQAVNLDGEGSAEVRRFVIDNALRWLRDFHVDALRLDAVHALVDDSPRHLLAELADEVAALAAELGRPLSLVAESDLNDAVMVTPTDQGGLGMTAQWADDVHHALHAFLTGERHGYYVDFGSAEVLAKVLTRVFLHDGGFSTFRGRDWGAPVPEGTDGHRFVVFAQDHDQVGNRALGDRPSERLDDAGLAASAALVLLSPFTPMLFMGEEWGARTRWQYFTDHAEPELVEGIRRGRREEFSGHGWTDVYGGEVEVPDPQDPATVEASRLDWSEPAQPRHAALLRWYTDLVAVRRAVPEVASGDLGATRVEHEAGRWLALHRGPVAVVVSLADDDVTVPVTPGGTTMLAAFGGASADATGVTLAGRAVAVVRSAA